MARWYEHGLLFAEGEAAVAALEAAAEADGGLPNADDGNNDDDGDGRSDSDSQAGGDDDADADPEAKSKGGGSDANNKNSSDRKSKSKRSGSGSGGKKKTKTKTTDLDVGPGATARSKRRGDGSSSTSGDAGDSDSDDCARDRAAGVKRNGFGVRSKHYVHSTSAVGVPADANGGGGGNGAAGAASSRGAGMRREQTADRLVSVPLDSFCIPPNEANSYNTFTLLRVNYNNAAANVNTPMESNYLAGSPANGAAARSAGHTGTGAFGGTLVPESVAIKTQDRKNGAGKSKSKSDSKDVKNDKNCDNNKDVSKGQDVKNEAVFDLDAFTGNNSTIATNAAAISASHGPVRDSDELSTIVKSATMDVMCLVPSAAAARKRASASNAAGARGVIVTVTEAAEDEENADSKAGSNDGEPGEVAFSQQQSQPPVTDRATASATPASSTHGYNSLGHGRSSSVSSARGGGMVHSVTFTNTSTAASASASRSNNTSSDANSAGGNSVAANVMGASTIAPIIATNYPGSAAFKRGKGKFATAADADADADAGVDADADAVDDDAVELSDSDNAPETAVETETEAEVEVEANDLVTDISIGNNTTNVNNNAQIDDIDNTSTEKPRGDIADPVHAVAITDFGDLLGDINRSASLDAGFF